MEPIFLRRSRALDKIEKNLNDFLRFNPLFKRYIPAFDSAFDRGVQADLNYYICRKDVDGNDFESTFAKILISEHSNTIGKIYVLHGSVGSGKTTLCRYWSEKHPIMSSPQSLVVHVDVWPREVNPDTLTDGSSVLTKLFKEATYQSFLLRRLCHNKGEFYKKIFSSLGFEPADNEIAYRMSNQMTPEDILESIINMDIFENILIIIDNIDETTDFTIKQSISFGIQLAQHARRYETVPLTILIPLREYTINRFLDQDHFAHKALEPVRAEDVMISKIQHAKDEIKRSTTTYSQDVDYVKRGYGPEKIIARRITISDDSACEFLKALSAYILSEKEITLKDLLLGLSTGNLKFLIGNLYNFIHSCKLPLTSLFKAIFAPQEIVRTKDIFNKISFNIAIECLMCIHYPFYDVKSSHVLNIFNLSNSTAPNNFRNTLTMPRLLAFLSNNKEISYKKVISFFTQYGYGPNLINEAINKCLNFGLIKSEYGRYTTHFDDYSTLYISECGNMYLFSLIISRYLQFVCEDTPMPSQFIVDITSKYTDINPNLNGELAKQNRIKGAYKFLEFIENEEKIEKNYIANEIYKDWNTYIHQVGIFRNSRYWTLSEYIGEHIKKNIG